MPLGDAGGQELEYLVLGDACTQFHDDAGQGAFAPPDVRDTDDGRLLDQRVRHQFVLEFDRTDPLTATLDQILRTVDEPDATVRLDHCDIARAQPAIVSEALT